MEFNRSKSGPRPESRAEEDRVSDSGEQYSEGGTLHTFQLSEHNVGHTAESSGVGSAPVFQDQPRSNNHSVSRVQGAVSKDQRNSHHAPSILNNSREGRALDAGVQRERNRGN